MFIKCFLQFLVVIVDQLLNAAEIVSFHAPVVCQNDGRIEPEFAFTVRSPDMNVNGFLSFIGIEMKPE